MVDHAETFLSLFRAQLDAGLQAQPADSWSSFPLFQLLNNFLRSDGERRPVCVCQGRFPMMHLCERANEQAGLLITTFSHL